MKEGPQSMSVTIPGEATRTRPDAPKAPDVPYPRRSNAEVSVDTPSAAPTVELRSRSANIGNARGPEQRVNLPGSNDPALVSSWERIASEEEEERERQASSDETKRRIANQEALLRSIADQQADRSPKPSQMRMPPPPPGYENSPFAQLINPDERARNNAVPTELYVPPNLDELNRDIKMNLKRENALLGVVHPRDGESMPKPDLPFAEIKVANDAEGEEDEAEGALKSGAKKALSAVAKPFEKAAEGVGSFAVFQKNRILTYGKTMKEGFFANRHAKKFEKARGEFVQAESRVNEVKSQIAELDKVRAYEGEISPKDLVNIQKRYQALQAKLAKEIEARDTKELEAKTHEAQALNHENKKKLIAEEFSQIVDERTAPQKQKFEELTSTKDALSREIHEWRLSLQGESARLEKIKADALNNPYLKETFKQKIKQAEDRIMRSRKELTARAGQLVDAEAKLIKVGTVLQKWDIKKASYTGFAEEGVPEGLLRGESFAETKNAVTGKQTEPEAAFMMGRDLSFEDSDVNSDGFLEIENADLGYERKDAFSFDEWASAWNKIHGTKIQVYPEHMFSKVVLDSNRRAGTTANKAQFTALVRNYYLANPQLQKSVKLKPKQFDALADDVFAYLSRQALSAQENVESAA